VKPLELSISRPISRLVALFCNVVIVMVLSSGGATEFEGILGIALGLFVGSLGGGFLPSVFFVCISTRGWMLLNTLDLVELTAAWCDLLYE